MTRAYLLVLKKQVDGQSLAGRWTSTYKLDNSGNGVLKAFKDPAYQLSMVSVPGALNMRSRCAGEPRPLPAWRVPRSAWMPAYLTLEYISPTADSRSELM